MVQLTDNNFNDEVFKSKTPVLVDFWAEWCMPCKKLTPILDEVAKEYEGKIKFTKMNVDEGQGAASKYGIMSVPTMVIFKDGKIQQQIVGCVSKEELRKKISSLI